MISKQNIFSLLVVFYFLNLGFIYSQNYRNARAYIDDFEKNEAFVQESLVEYSSAIIFSHEDSRTQATLDRIYIKLESINKNISKNDIGFEGDTSLRDAFLKMNSSTINLLKNNSLRLTDYDEQKKLDFPEIFDCFDKRKQDIINYYCLILDYTTCKRNFCKSYNVKTNRYFANKNLFEYDAHQSLFFFKLNVLDAKLCDLLLTTDTENVNKCVYYLNHACDDILIETEKYKKVHIDQAFNNANIRLVQFILNQNESLIPMYTNYIQALNEFKLTKAKKDTPIELYNEKVRLLNKNKNLFYDNFNAMQLQKQQLIDDWYKIKSNFLKNNL